MSLTAAVELDVDGSQHVLALQRAENFAVVLLQSKEWNDRARAAVARRLEEHDRKQFAKWKLAGGQGNPPPDHNDIDVMRGLGADLAIDAYNLALGFAAGVRQVEKHFGQTAS